MVNRVVRHGQRAVAARIFRFELEIRVELFAGVHGDDGGLAVARVDAAAVGIEREFRIDQIAMVLEQPVDAV